jgi:molybdate transport system regulatory protein
MSYKVKGTIWIEGPGGTFLGAGRVNLLQKIAETGSISEAARQMNMSYRQAWEHVDAMNRESPTPIVITNTGGSGGGGTVVTKEGMKALKQFEKLHRRFKTFTERETSKVRL